MSKLTLPKIRTFKREGRKIVVLTVYDYPSARLLDNAGVDLLLVGDSLGNVVQGKTTTLSVTLDEIIYHAEMVVRAVERSFVVVDLPFPFCQLGAAEAVRAAARIFKETSADAVKFEGGKNRASTITALVDAGIPVLGHCGIRPQEIRQTGGYFVQREKDREQLFQDIEAVEKAGAFAIVLECIETTLAQEATNLLQIPTIGIGAGPYCDGQVLVFHDLLGYKPEQDRTPKHVKQYADLRTMIFSAVRNYAEDVRTSAFPGKENSF
ncbi:MAG: 3-methyl-2-oxobutanoate hydroxymethyltransferase [Planctomycetaceae bacterium]|jgi:3-methyl-2-oxobutanoate hydroxymethyltransferase|nr:3-methyl-2-oxobutanoate hydroxymethyltransferase [Planctomycetaceae bacterium]